MKMIISMVIEANANNIHEIKGKILETACEAIVSCSIDVLPEPKKDIEIPKFVTTGKCAENPASTMQERVLVNLYSNR